MFDVKDQDTVYGPIKKGSKNYSPNDGVIIIDQAGVKIGVTFSILASHYDLEKEKIHKLLAGINVMEIIFKSFSNPLS